MASSSTDNDQLTLSTHVGAVVAHVLQEQLFDGMENTAQTAASTARGVVSDFDNLILGDTTDSSRFAGVGDTCVSSEASVTTTAISVANAFSDLESDLSSTCNQIIASVGIHNNNEFDGTLPPPPTGQYQAQASTSSQEQTQVRHIMISYHHDSSYDICRRIFRQLTSRGYKVWMDTDDLHGSIHEGMAKAIDDAYVVLFFMNRRYYESGFCQKEAVYTDKMDVQFIPCLLENGYTPTGWLGIIIRDRMYIDFSSPDEFDMAFEALIAEIQAVEHHLQVSPGRSINQMQQTFALPNDPGSQDISVINATATDPSTNLRAVIRSFRESINQNHQDAHPMTEEEFSQFVNYIREQVFPSTSPLPQADFNNSREILYELLRHSRNQTESLRQIADILSNLTETRTIIKSSLAFAFVWTMHTFLTRR